MVEREQRYINPLREVAREAVWFIDRERIVDKPDSVVSVYSETIAKSTAGVATAWNILSHQQRQRPDVFFQKLSVGELVTLIATDAQILEATGVTDAKLSEILIVTAQKEIDAKLEVFTLPAAELESLRHQTNLYMAEIGGHGKYIATLEEYKEDFFGRSVLPLRSLQQKLQGKKPLRCVPSRL